MKKNDSSFSIIICFLVLFIIGASLIPLLSIKFNPSNKQSQLSVNYYWSKASSRIIENEVGSKLESVFSSIKELREINSSATNQGGSINMKFDKDADMDMLRFEVLSLIRQIYSHLPDGVSYPTINSRSKDEEAHTLMVYNINGSANPWTIQKFAQKNISSNIANIAGINEVNIYGASPFEWNIAYDREKIKTLNINIEDIKKALNNYFTKYELGVLCKKNEYDNNSEMHQVFFSSRNTDSLEANKIPVSKLGDRTIFLSEIAKITYKEKEPDSYYRINGLNTINIIIKNSGETNQIKLANKVREQIRNIKKTLPKGYSISLSYDSTEFIHKELNKISWRIALSIFILLLFVYLINRQWKYLLLIIVSLIANLAIACIFYYILKIEIHIYALAGITVSLGMIMDNAIISIDHIKNRGNNNSFMAILAATLTTIGSLSIIFFLSEAQKLKLIDFAWVMIINLGVSLLIALFLLPALLEKIKLKPSSDYKKISHKRNIIMLNSIFERYIIFQDKYKWIFILIIILTFGLPVQLLPKQLGEENTEITFFQESYNNTLGSDWYNNTARPISEKILGGTLRLFTDYVFENSHYNEPSRTKLYIRGKMPKGGTIKQIDQSMRFIENKLANYKQIDQFTTKVYNAQEATIEISFTDKAEKEGFQYTLKTILTSYAINRGGMDWYIYGVGRSFNNSISGVNDNSNIMIYGYNYDQLYSIANDLKHELLTQKRIKKVNILGSQSWGSNLNYEYKLELNKKALIRNDFDLGDIHHHLWQVIGSEKHKYLFDKEIQDIRIESDKKDKYDVWTLKNEKIDKIEHSIKLKNIASIQKKALGNNIYKKNQEYQLCLSYNFIGPKKTGKKIQKNIVDKMRPKLALGYRIKQGAWVVWTKEKKTSYCLLALVILIIYFICSILLESLKQPLAVIACIPISFIGVFLTFYCLDFNFDQGGYAAFIMLCGISVNSALYIINEKNNIEKERPKLARLKTYTKAYNFKITPILLTITSTILGLIPFVISGQKEVFWFALAVGTIGGLIFSLLAIVVFLPIFLKLK